MKEIDHAAAQDMRWWFLALLVVVGIAIWRLNRDQKITEKEQTARLDSALKSHITYVQEQHGRLCGVVENNSAAMREFSEVVNAVKHLFQK